MAEVVFLSGGFEEIGPEIEPDEIADPAQEGFRLGDEILVKECLGGFGVAPDQFQKTAGPFAQFADFMRQFAAFTQARREQGAGIADEENQPQPFGPFQAGHPVESAFGKVEQQGSMFGLTEGVQIFDPGFPVLAEDFGANLGQVPRPEGTVGQGLAAGAGEVFIQGVVEPEKFAGADHVGVPVQHAAQQGGSAVGVAQNDDQIEF